MKNTIFSICLFLLGASLLPAQAPNLLPWQGAFRDKDDQPQNGTLDLRFRLLRGSATGAVAFEETNPTVPVKLGVASHVLGSINTVGFAAIDWSNGPYFLQVARYKTGSGYEIAGTPEQLKSVPYALNAKGLDLPFKKVVPGDGELNIGLSNIEIRDYSPGGTPFIDFAKTPASDFDARLIYGGDALGVVGAPFAVGTDFSEGYRMRVNHANKGLNIRHETTGKHWELWTANTSDGNLELWANSVKRGSFNSGTGAYSTNSDRRLKENIRPMEKALNKLKSLTPQAYNYISDPSRTQVIGFIAQDVQPLFPELVTTSKNRETGEDMLSLDYAGFSVVAIKAIQEQQALIEEQSTKIALLEERLKVLEAKIGK